MDKWKAELLVKMRINRVTQKQLAEQLGVTPQYVNMVFSGSKSPKKAEINFNTAFETIISQRLSQKQDSTQRR